MIYVMHRVRIELFKVFQALSDPTRLRILRLMRQANEELCLSDLAEALDEPEYKLSRHIKILKSHGLLTSVREGKWIYHSLVQDQLFLRTILKALAEFPGSDAELKSDFIRFKKRLKVRHL
jgi:ArsR family transcriptional regulator